jgi:cytochrome c5
MGGKPSMLLAALALGLGLAGCKFGASPSSFGAGQSQGGEVRAVAASEGEAEHESYTWALPQYPENYQVEPLARSYLSGREQSNPLGSYAGPWIEGKAAKELPAGAPNVFEGERLLRLISNLVAVDSSGAYKPPQMKSPVTGLQVDESPATLLAQVRAAGGVISEAMLPEIKETPFEAFQKLKIGLKDVLIEGNHLSIDQIWHITFALYRGLQPDVREKVEVPIVTKLDPESQSDVSKRKIGAQLYGANCSMCHGADGWGMGHAGHGLQPHPANFHDPHRLFNRSEERLRQVLRDGVYGSAMPPWRDKLSATEIEHVVAFIRAFSYDTSTPPSITAPKTGGQQ